MKTFLKNKWTVVGLVLVVLGWGPFFVVLVLRVSGSRPHVDFNGLGLLFFASFWPTIVCFALAIAQSVKKHRLVSNGHDGHEGDR